MNTYLFKPIAKENIFSIIPLLKKLNDKTPDELLKKRLSEMVRENYECVGLYDDEKLIGISGIWYMTRHYIGKSAEVDHVIIDENYRNSGLGKFFFDQIYNYVKQKGCEATELNTYTGNRKSHKFYCNEGYEIYGFHMLKVIREDKEFY